MARDKETGHRVLWVGVIDSVELCREDVEVTNLNDRVETLEKLYLAVSQQRSHDRWSRHWG